MYTTTEGLPNTMVSWFLILSYLYYICDISLVEDEAFDKMCGRMLAKWDTLEHKHKNLINVEDLRAGTGFALKDADYPEHVKAAATQLCHTYGCAVPNPKFKEKRRGKTKRVS